MVALRPLNPPLELSIGCLSFDRSHAHSHKHGLEKMGIPVFSFSLRTRRPSPFRACTMPSTAFIPHILPMQAPISLRTTTCSIRLNPIPTTAYIAYMSHLFLFPPTPSIPSQALAEATNLSLNFAYLIPTFFPHLTAPNHPMLEAIFHIVVAWALLLLAFTSDSIREETEFTLPAAPFLIGAAFLTNIFYLPYLALRSNTNDTFPKLHKTLLLTLSESRALPIFSIALLVVSIVWGWIARPEFGDFQTRLQSFRYVIESDILAYSFVVDVLIFSVFQAWLVPDDAKRRKWSNRRARDFAVNLSRIPFIGLAAYVFLRASKARIQWVADS